MDHSYALMDLTAHGRQEQWSRLDAGHSDDLSAAGPTNRPAGRR